jgi:hypothetical protein
MAQRHGEPFRGDAMTEQAIAQKAMTAHATDETAVHRGRTAFGPTSQYDSGGEGATPLPRHWFIDGQIYLLYQPRSQYVYGQADSMHIQSSCYSSTARQY